MCRYTRLLELLLVNMGSSSSVAAASTAAISLFTTAAVSISYYVLGHISLDYGELFEFPEWWCYYWIERMPWVKGKGCCFPILDAFPPRSTVQTEIDESVTLP